MKHCKKTTSIVLALTLVFSSLACLSFTSSAAAPAVTDTVTYSFLTSIDASKSLHVQGILNDYQLGSRTLDIPFTIDAKENSVSIEAKLSFLSLRALYADGKLYIFIPLFRLYADATSFAGSIGSTIENLLSRIWNEAQYFSQDFVLGETSSAADFNGATYAMETIIENTQTPSFNAKVYYNSDKQIKGVVAYSSTLGRTFNISVDELSTQADEAMLVFPSFYFNLTPLVLAVFSWLVGDIA